jgi:hypothetical protein
MAAKPNDPYVVQSSVPSGDPPAPHAAYDAMFSAPEMTGADGDDWQELPDQ